MMGLNNENRKMVIESFIIKCQEVGIEIVYTNFTKKELDDAIDSYVAQIKVLLKKDPPISIEAISKLDPNITNNSFYSEYVKWCKRPENICGDYNRFKTALREKAFHVLAPFKMITFTDFYSKLNYREEFEESELSLKEYKSQHNRKIVDSAIKADINNYYYIKNLNSKTQANNFFSINNFLISADHVFSNWEKEIRPSSVPIISLPSVWYSIILQYAGRSNDDYFSFSQFLCFNFSDYIEDEDPRKIEILKKVLAMDTSADIKERTVFDISEKLQKEYLDLESDEIVEKSYKNVTDQIIDEYKKKVCIEKEEAVQKERQNAKMESEIKEAEYNANLKQIANQKDEQIKLLKVENANLKKEENDRVNKAESDEFDRIVEIEAKNRTNSILSKYWKITWIIIIMSVIILCIILYVINQDTDNLKIVKNLLESIGAAPLVTVYVFIGGAIINYGFKGLDRNKIYADVKEKVEKEYRK